MIKVAKIEIIFVDEANDIATAIFVDGTLVF